MTIQAKKTDNTLGIIQPNMLLDLEASIRGKIIKQGDTNYDEARKVWNAMIDSHPAFIVRCTGTADIMQAVRFAKQHKLLVSVRGAGHNIAGRALQDNVMLIDLSGMTSVQVDPHTQTVVVSPGATLRDVDHETQVFGLATPVGINSTTGIAGLTLGGGFGWLSRKYGLTIDNLMSVEVVTVAGERIICDENNNAELFWAIRGGGGNFGIVTSFKFKLHTVGPEVMAGPIVFSIDDAKQVLKNYYDFCKNSPDELCVWAVLRNAPPFPFLDINYHGKPVLILACLYSGAIDDGKKEIAKVKLLGNPIADATGVIQYKNFQQAFDPLLTPGARNYWKTHNFTEINDDLIKILIEYAKKIPNSLSEIFIAQVGGATNRIKQDATAYPHRNIEFIMNVHTRWEEKNKDNECVAWARDFYQTSLPFATGGAYVNFISAGDDNLKNAYGENIKRLSAIKAKYDPNNVLRSNLNVTPSSKI